MEGIVVIQKYFLPWLVLYTLWDLAVFILVMLDKRRTRRSEWRISERTFFIWYLVTGTVSEFIGMHVFRHRI